jgi:hypothetical protein
MNMSLKTRTPAAMQVSFGDGRTEEIREGTRLTLKGREGNSPVVLFHMAVASSWDLNGQAVLMTGFLPGILMLVQAPKPHLSGDQAEARLSDMWRAIWPYFSRWSLLDPHTAPVMEGRDGSTRICFAWNHFYQWLPATVHFDVVEDFSTPDAAPRSPRSWNARYAPTTDHELRAVQGSRDAARAALDSAIEEALHLTLIADDATFKSLPVPVRYRATGAMAAWDAAYRVSGAEGRRITAMLSDAHMDPRLTGAEIAAFIEQHCTIRLTTHAGADLLRHAANSVLSQAFWAREGALYEPTQALHQLVEQSDMATDIPVGSLSLPSKALCVLPAPAMRIQADGFDALFVLEHGMPGATHGDDRWLTFGMSRNHESVETGLIGLFVCECKRCDGPVGQFDRAGAGDFRIKSWDVEAGHRLCGQADALPVIGNCHHSSRSGLFSSAPNILGVGKTQARATDRRDWKALRPLSDWPCGAARHRQGSRGG